MKHFISFVMLLLIFAPFRAGAEDLIRKDEMLTLQRCVEIALVKHPTIVAAQNNVNASESRVFEAKSNYYPQIAANAGYSRIKPITGAQRIVSTGVDGTSAGNLTNSFDQFTAGLTLFQNIYDFGKTSAQVDIQKFLLNSSKSDLETTVDQVLLGVKQAYYGLLQAIRNKDVAVDT